MGSGFDRLSRSVSGLERLVPGPLRGEAELALARNALAANRPGEAMGHARAATVAMPVASDGPSAIGLAYFLAGDNAKADTAFRAAAAGGWRDPMTQIYWAQQSAGAGEWDLAAARIDAVLRARPEHPLADNLREPFATSPQGLDELGRKLAEAPDWLDPLLIPAETTSDKTLRERARLVAAAARHGQPFGCARVASFTRVLLERGASAPAREVWAAHCPQARSAGLLVDGDFERASLDGAEPFGWTFRSSGDLVLDLVDNGPGRAVEAVNESSSARLVASQPLYAKGRAVAVGWIAREADGSESRRVDLSLDCGDAATRPSFDAKGKRSFGVLACDEASLGIWVKAGPGPVRIERVYLDRN